MSESRKRKAGTEMREGDWKCAECDAHNYSARITCYRCSLNKQRSDILTKGKAAHDWECFECKTDNFAWREECYKCKIPRFASEDMRIQRQGVDWLCRFCELKNYPYRDSCFKCKKSREMCDINPPRRGPSPPRRGPSPPRGPGPVRGRSPPRMMRLRSPMRRRSPPRRSPPRRSPPRRYSPPRRVEHVEEWRCRLCGTGNGIRRPDCYKCTTPRGEEQQRRPPLLQQATPLRGGPVHTRIGGSGNILTEEGDWDCPKCHINNFRFRSKCFKCQEKRPVETKEAPGPVRSTMLNHSSIADPRPEVSRRGLLSTPPQRSDEYYEPESPKRRRRNSDAAHMTREEYGPDWECRFCNVDIFPKRTTCYKCGRDRSECDTEGGGPLIRIQCSPPRALPPREQRPLKEYRCKGCGTRTVFNNVCCTVCGKNRKGDSGGLNNLDWDCAECSINNYHYRNSCFKCGKSRVQCEAKPEFYNKGGDQGDWFCNTCGVGNSVLDQACRRCRERRGFRARSRSPPPRGYNDGPQRRYNDDPQRGYNDDPQRGYNDDPQGSMFSPGRGGGRRGPSSVRFLELQKKNPDWECRVCLINNFAKREKCFRCHKLRAKVELKLDARGNLIGPNDWECPSKKCKANNYSRRTQCFSCGIAKPGSKEEEEEEEEEMDALEEVGENSMVSLEV